MTNSIAFMRAAVIGLSLAATSAPALAGESENAEKAQLTLDAKTGKYCYKASFTGTRMSRSVCRTREQWAEEGVKIPAKADTEIAKK